MIGGKEGLPYVPLNFSSDREVVQSITRTFAVPRIAVNVHAGSQRGVENSKTGRIGDCRPGPARQATMPVN
jgi:hypothetical protein